MTGDADSVRRHALDPAASVWVAASAGTGKTQVLTDRLLALMLDDTDPARILCLTFTRAAAAEMANRINQRLAAWTTLPPGALEEELVALTGRFPDNWETARARQLFARILDVPGGAKIATIHAFCQSLLRRFPLEAGVPPEFAVIDERDAAEALAEAAAAVIQTARDNDKGALAEALAVVAGYAPEERFLELMTALVAERRKLDAALAGGEAALRRRLCAALAVDPDATSASIATAFCAAGAADYTGLREAAAALDKGAATDRALAAIIARWGANRAERHDLLQSYILAFLTKEGAIRQRILAGPHAALRDEAERILRFEAERAGAALVEATIALVRLGAALLDRYERQKRLRGLLDYDDLVLKALELLRRPEVASWILFKLDGGIDHILIDEAQDTNPEQWEIVALLAAEFFTGEGAGDARARTVFAVGDGKQSIYSFQGADPREFLRMREHFQKRVNEAKQKWRVVPLDTSFRATRPLLDAVDAVFAHPEAANGVALDGDPIRHVAARQGHAGVVELWPPVVPQAEESADPMCHAAPGSRALEPPARLARAIAATIAQWLEEGERLAPRGRALTPGDVMVLVRRRNAFVRELLRALKEEGVPVGGADRLVLADELAVQDLVALGRFLLLPEDDLTLAAVLKGPLFGLTEEELYRLAYDRGDATLWGRLRRFAGESPVFAAAHERLRELLAQADFIPPFELYAEILGAAGGRRAMLERLGPDAEDPIEEFLASALAYERDHVPSLQGFLRWTVAGDIEVKRDFGERQRDEVRILTVHGAKGLEAPIVFLPDTLQLPDPQVRILWSERTGLPLWRPRRELGAPFYKTERDAWRQGQLQEYRRLLYVALTRAQDRLYVCGWETRRPVKEALTWHALCRAGWDGTATAMRFDNRPLIGDLNGWSGDALRLEAPQTMPPKREPAPAGLLAAGAMPGWALAPPPPEPSPPKPLLPSRPSGPEPATLSPLAVAGRDRFKRGLLVHRLLQSLPELPAAQREAAARCFLALPLHALDAETQDEICAETLAVLADPALAELWGADARAEVPVVGLIGEQALSGQIDRLVVSEDHVLIVDFKSVRPAPAAESEVSALYLRQLATYRAALARIYPDRPVECALLWTDGPSLMRISPELLDRYF